MIILLIPQLLIILWSFNKHETANNSNTLGRTCANGYLADNQMLHHYHDLSGEEWNGMEAGDLLVYDDAGIFPGCQSTLVQAKNKKVWQT
jgi:hypothetical protein